MPRHLAFIGSYPPVGRACDDWPATTIEAVNSYKRKRGSHWQPPPLLLCASGGAKSRAAELGAGFACSARPPSYRGRGMGISPTYGISGQAGVRNTWNVQGQCQRLKVGNGRGDRSCHIPGCPSPYISHHLCMIGQICDETRLLFCRCGTPWHLETRECLNDYLTTKVAKRSRWARGLMPRGLRVAATCVRRARPARWRQRRDAWQRSPRYGLPDTLTPSQP